MIRKLFVFWLLLAGASGMTEDIVQIVERINQHLDWCMEQYTIKYVVFASRFADAGLREFVYDKNDMISRQFAIYNAPILDCPMDQEFDEAAWQNNFKSKVFPAVISLDNETITDIYVYADSVCKRLQNCSDDFSTVAMLSEDFLANMPRVYNGFQFPLVDPMDFKSKRSVEPLRSDCLDIYGYRTTPFNDVETCVTLYQKRQNPTELWRVGRLSINNVDQSSALGAPSKSDLFAFYMNQEFCFTYQSGNEDLFSRRHCRGILTRAKYTLLCCCYTKRVECHLPNPHSYMYNPPKVDVEKHPREYSCVRGSNIVKVRAFHEAEEKNQTQWLDHETRDVDYLLQTRFCFTSFSYNNTDSDIDVNFVGVSDDTKNENEHRVCAYNLPFGGGYCIAHNDYSDCPSMEFNMSKYHMDCCCSSDLCNAQFFYDSYDFFRRSLGISPTAMSDDLYNRKRRYCSYFTLVMDAFQSFDDKYMCSVFYDVMNRQQLYLYNGFNARIHFDLAGTWERNETALVLMSFPKCLKMGNGEKLFPVFVLNCGPPTSEDRSKYRDCDKKLSEQLPSKYEEVTKQLPKCLNVDELVLSDDGEVRRLPRTLSKISSFSFPGETLFCHVTVNSVFDNKKKRMKHAVKAGPADKTQLDECSKLLNESKDAPRAYRICYTDLGSDLGSSHTMCCCFVGVGFQSCNAIEIIIEIVTSNDVKIVRPSDVNAIDRSAGMSACDASYAAEIVKNANNRCYRRIGCYHIYSEKKSSEFQLWAGCTSNIPMESVEASRTAFAAYCRSQDPALERVSMKHGFVDYDYEASTTTTTTAKIELPYRPEAIVNKCFVVDFSLFMRDMYKMENDTVPNGAIRGKSAHPLSPLTENMTRLCCCYYGNCPDVLSTRWGFVIPG